PASFGAADHRRLGGGSAGRGDPGGNAAPGTDAPVHAQVLRGGADAVRDRFAARRQPLPVRRYDLFHLPRNGARMNDAGGWMDQLLVVALSSARFGFAFVL